MAIEALRAHAAPGSNGIAAILLQKGGEGATALIYKGNGHRLDLNSYRGISSINVEGKAYGR